TASGNFSTRSPAVSGTALMFRELDDYAFVQIGLQKSGKSRKLPAQHPCPLNLKLRFGYKLATFCLWTWSVIRPCSSTRSANIRSTRLKLFVIPRRSAVREKLGS